MVRRTPTAMVVLASFIAAGLGACSSDGGSPGGDARSRFCRDGKISVSYSGPLSGTSADFGEQQVRGIRLAIEKVSREGAIAAGDLKGCTISLEGPFDDQSSSSTGVQIATKLAREDHILAYLGNVNSPVVLATEPILARAGIPMLVSYASSPAITQQGNENVFRTILNGNQYGAEIARILVKDLKRARIAAAFVNDAYGQPQIAALRESVPKLGAELVVDFSYQTGQTDFAAFVSKAKSARADGIAILGNYSEGALITAQLAAAGLTASDSTVSIVGAAGSNSPQFVKIAKAAAENVYFASNWNPGAASEASAEFVRAYRAAYNEDPSEPAATGYDSLLLFAKAVAAGGADRTRLIDSLRGTKYSGVTGSFTFDDSGQATGLRLSLLQVRAGKIQPASPQAGS